MTRILDNIDAELLPALRTTLKASDRADFCVGYLNLRGWSKLADVVERFEGTDSSCCRVIVGMTRQPHDVVCDAYRASPTDQEIDAPTAVRLKRGCAAAFKEQIECGVPTRADEASLRQLAGQLRSRKTRVKVFVREQVHAKLYLLHCPDSDAPLVGYVGSSNLTLAGLSRQAELNLDVTDQDATGKLQRWFEARWADRFAFDISAELAQLIESSWATLQDLLPYHVYLKMAYHLCEAALQGEREYKLPALFRGVMADFQAAAVSVVAQKLNRHGGVLLGDVVGLGKTLMASAVAKVFEEDEGPGVLIICPPTLEDMWRGYVRKYQLHAELLSLGKVVTELPRMPRYRLVLIDESHNLRNREGKRYHAIHEYIERNDSKVLLITATPYNKQFTDLSNQLRLFLEEDQDLRVRPELFFQQWAQQGFNEADFVARFQASPRSLRAFEQSRFPADWRDLMRLYLVRRPRQHIIQYYAKYDPDDTEKKRPYVMLGGERFYFPVRQPRNCTFTVDEGDPEDPYARLYRDEVVQVIGELKLPRYGLANYLVDDACRQAKPAEKKILDDLNRAGRRLIGFCRTNLFKRLESDGYSFLLSRDRHILRNLVTLHALQQGLPVPIGTQDAALLDEALSDGDPYWEPDDANQNGAEGDPERAPAVCASARDLRACRARAAEVYRLYREQYAGRFHWLDARFFTPGLQGDLLADAQALLGVLEPSAQWEPQYDAKLDTLYRLLTQTHRRDKVLVFTQFADTAVYLEEQLMRRGLKDVAAATGDSADPVALARRFSPSTNDGLRPGESELRVLIATDVLAEGQNLQDAHVVVNFDLPWAIIRLVQRVGRVDRIGQSSETILAYSFMPVQGVEQIIRLRQRLLKRLEENQEVVGTDESFFGEDAVARLRLIYTEKSGALDDEGDEDTDLVSQAQEVWKSATEADRRTVLNLPPVVPTARAVSAGPQDPSPVPGVIAYLRFPDGTDALVRVDAQGALVSQSLSVLFRAAACPAGTPAAPRAENHHELVAQCVRLATQEQIGLGGQLGSLRSIRRKVWERLKRHRELLQQRPTLFSADLLQRLSPAFDTVFRFPLKEGARDALGRQMRLGIGDDELAELVIQLYQDQRLCAIEEQTGPTPEPQILCSMGLR